MKFTIDLTGIEPLIKKLQEFEEAVSGKISRRAITHISQILARELKTAVPADTGTLSRAMGYKVRKVRGKAIVYGIIGARKDMSRTVTEKSGATRKHDPVKYAHLVEKGRKAVLVKAKRVLSDGAVIYGTRVRAVPPTNFMSKTRDRMKDRVLQVVASEIRAGIQAEIGK